MNIQMRKNIDRLANTIQDIYHINVPIHDMNEVVQTLGGKISFDSNVIDGKIQKSGKGFNIFLGSQDFNSSRNRFTIAHELGHLFLHMGYKIDLQRWESVNESVYNRLGFSAEESQANEFAAAFLMPAEQFLKQAEITSTDSVLDIPALAEYFHVSQLAAINRAKYLRLISW